MISVTPFAIEHLSGTIRLAVHGGGCSGFGYSMRVETDPPKPFDKVFTFGDVKIIVDQASLLYLEGTEIDYQQSLMGSGFVFNNSQHRQCGCGSSFSLSDKCSTQ